MALSRGDAETLRIGSTAYAVKRKASTHQWKQIVSRAHARGQSVNEYLTGDTISPTVRPLSPGQIQQEANARVKAQFDPVYQSLDVRQHQLQALSDKRNQDDEYYKQWLTSQGEKLVADHRAAQAQLSATQAAGHSAVEDFLKMAQGQGPMAGGDPTQGTAYQQTQQKDAASAALAGAQQARVSAVGGANSGAVDATQLNNAAWMASQHAKTQGDVWKGMLDLFAERGADVLKEAGANADEVARLKNLELNKANIRLSRENQAANRDIAAQQLGAKTDYQNAQLKLAAGRLGETTAHDRAGEAAARARLADSIQKTNLTKKRLDLDWYKVRHPKTTRSATSGGGSAQERFDLGVGSLAAGTFLDKNGKKKQMSPGYVRANRAAVKAQLQKSLKITGKMADTIIEGFISGGQAVSGVDYHNWLPGGAKVYTGRT